jgi:hypothetical protein
LTYELNETKESVSVHFVEPRRAKLQEFMERRLDKVRLSR